MKLDGESEDGHCDEVRWCVQDEVNHEKSEQDEVGRNEERSWFHRWWCIRGVL